jgi:hypothetical protein
VFSDIKRICNRLSLVLSRLEPVRGWGGLGGWGEQPGEPPVRLKTLVQRELQTKPSEYTLGLTLEEVEEHVRGNYPPGVFSNSNVFSKS